MRINFDRLSKLAGLPATQSRGGSLNEGKKHDKEHDKDLEETMHEKDHDELDEMADIAYMNEEDEAHEGMGMHYEEDDMDEMIDVDEAMLVQELRRAKRIMQENKRRKQLNETKKRQRQQRLFEAQLKSIIDEEVQSVFDEMQITGQWVYGRNKPTRSKRGYTHQGNFIPGVGFKR